jgi:YVTN family beta-propeller protein
MLTPDGTQAHVANDGSNNVSVIDVATRQVLLTYEAGEGPHGISFNLDGTEAYVSDIAGDSVSVVSFVN